MEKSYQEILKVLKLMKEKKYEKVTYRGSNTYLPDESTPVDSPAARNLVKRAMEREDDNPLYVVAIGAITNVASAILMEPEIIKKIVIVWLGGNALHWPDNHEFNAYQDVAADRVIFGSGVP
ncbi:MAG: nucleoside hydrolase [Blautia marasmi]